MTPACAANDAINGAPDGGSNDGGSNDAVSNDAGDSASAPRDFTRTMPAFQERSSLTD